MNNTPTLTTTKNAVKLVFLSIALALAVLASVWIGRESAYLEIKIKTDSTSILESSRPAPVLHCDVGQGQGRAAPIRGTFASKVYSGGFRKLSFLLPADKKITAFRFDLGNGALNAYLHDAKITKKTPTELFQSQLTTFSSSDFLLPNSKIQTSAIKDGKLQIQSSAGTAAYFGLKLVKPFASDTSTNWLQSGIVFALLFSLWIYIAKKILPSGFAGKVFQSTREKITLEDFNLFPPTPTDFVSIKNITIRTVFSNFLVEKRLYILVAFGFVLCVINYWFELTNYTFSFDEGRFFSGHISHVYYSESRWILALLYSIIPVEIGALPFLSTAICCVAFSFSAAILATVIFQRLRFQLLFIALFVTCPVLPHSVEYSDNSWGVALGYLLASLAVRTVLTDKFGTKQLTLTVFLLACAVGCYQSHVFYFFGASVMAIIMRQKPLKSFFSACLVSTFAVPLSLAIGKIFQFIFDVNVTRSFFDIAISLKNFGTSAKFAGEVLTGSSGLFIQTGIASMLTVYVGVGVAILRFVKNKKLPSPKVSMFFVCAVLGAVAVIFLYQWRAPYRSLGAFVPLYAFVGACAVCLSRPKWIVFAVASVSILTNVYISTSLFYSDYVARLRDNLQTTAMYSRMIEVEPQLGKKKVKIAFEGRLYHEESRIAKRSNAFGVSFFDTEWRINAIWYFRLLGIKKFAIRRITPIFRYYARGGYCKLQSSSLAG
ncbi:MAG: glucosyltransferase domain-containing protein [Puniceicoccales bacterium]|jgi:hypothetical protein|nr:glucosyltransferase domain-containing protein [Puniceicoccales bacterium]